MRWRIHGSQVRKWSSWDSNPSVRLQSPCSSPPGFPSPPSGSSRTPSSSTSPHPSGVPTIWNLVPRCPAKKINGNHVLWVSGCSHLRPPAFCAETDPPITGKSCPWAGAQVLTGPLSPGKPFASSRSSNAFQPWGGECWPALAVAINP